jgi:hypothetical protein
MEHARVADPYAPPASAVPTPKASRRWSAEGGRNTRRRTVSLVLLFASFVVVVAAIVFDRAVEPRPVTFVAGIASAMLAFAGLAFAVMALRRDVRAEPAATAASLLASALAVFANLAMIGVGALTAFLSTLEFTRGRQLRRFGKILLPPMRSGSAWTRSELRLAEDALDEETRAGVALQWRENGRTEHASVAAFARLTLDLVALGAPPALVASAQRDALDEIRHAELCFSLARAIDGRQESPAPFAAAGRVRPRSRIRVVALAELAVDSLVDGALHEGVSARIVAKLARRAADPAIRAMLRQIAADEGRHAAHGWDVVQWCVEEGGAPVARALATALDVLPKTMRSELPDAARDGGWERFGIMGSRLES